MNEDKCIFWFVGSSIRLDETGQSEVLLDNDIW